MIWLLRHGDAEAGSPDAERPLTSKGQAQARAAGLTLAVLEVGITLCICSPKVRALETARLACEPLGIEPHEDRALAGGPFDARELAGDVESVLLVGHEPDFSLAVHDMTGAHVRMKKGGLAGVDRGELAVLMRPAEIARIAASRS